MQIPLIILNLVLLLIALGITITYFFMFIFPLSGGAPYVPSDVAKVTKMLDLAEMRPGEKVVDLGSGDGRIVIEAARSGVDAYGYEISPFLVFWSNILIKKAGMTAKAHIVKRSFWDENFSKFDVIFLYQLPYVMAQMENKLWQELKPGARIVCNGFKMPNLPVDKEQNGVFLYRKT